MASAGLIYGPEFHHLDHLAPLCAELQIPLIVTEPSLSCQASTFYPELDVIHWAPLEAPEKLVTHFDTIIYSTPRVPFEEVFFFAQAFNKKRIRTIWCPHGNSDKGRNSPFMEALVNEEHLLTYGPRIEAFLKEKGITASMTRVGNYRYHYYKKHRAFYDEFLLTKKKPTLLYAPTWQDREHNSSFPTLWPHLLNTPPEYSLIIKLHPHLYHQFPEEIQTLKTKAPQNVTLLEDFPLIYPLLAQTDLFISDMSSIAYDFLAFNKPMISLHPSGLGSYLTPEKYPDFFDYCKEVLKKPIEQTSLYEKTFDEKITLRQFRL